MNPSQFSSMDPLLVKYLLHETTGEETALAEQWIAELPEHQHYFEQLKTVWRQTKSLDQAIPPDEEEAWQRFRTRTGVRPKSSRPIRGWHIARTAALWLVIIGGAWMAYQVFRPAGGGLILASGATAKTDTLPDGTVITLNKHSTIRLSAGFSRHSRALTLEGEAFFDVSANNDLPFTVQAPQATITVLGTSFNINSRDKQTEVIVEHGEVKVSGPENSVQLSAGEKVVVGPGNKPINKQKVQNELYNYYRTGTLVCQSTPLSAVIRSLNEAYETDISLDNNTLGELPLTTTFYLTQPLDSILSIIQQTFPEITVSRQGTQIRLK
jgi:ferric-dicitrate binding protein FerR (iron transport regulator)